MIFRSVAFACLMGGFVLGCLPKDVWATPQNVCTLSEAQTSEQLLSAKPTSFDERYEEARRLTKFSTKSEFESSAELEARLKNQTLKTLIIDVKPSTEPRFDTDKNSWRIGFDVRRHDRLNLKDFGPSYWPMDVSRSPIFFGNTKHLDQVRSNVTELVVDKEFFEGTGGRINSIIEGVLAFDAGPDFISEIPSEIEIPMNASEAKRSAASIKGARLRIEMLAKFGTAARYTLSSSQRTYSKTGSSLYVYFGGKISKASVLDGNGRIICTLAKKPSQKSREAEKPSIQQEAAITSKKIQSQSADSIQPKANEAPAKSFQTNARESKRSLAEEKPVLAPSSLASRIVVRANASSWIQVRDDNVNELILTRLLRAGDSYPVPHKPGLVLLTGNANALEIFVDGMKAPAIDGGGVRRSIVLDAERLRLGTAAIE